MIKPSQQSCQFFNCCNFRLPSEELLSPSDIQTSSNKISLKRVSSAPSNQLISRQALSPPISKFKHISKQQTSIAPSTTLLSSLQSPKSIAQNYSPRVQFSWRTNKLQRTNCKSNKVLFPQVSEMEMHETRQMRRQTSQFLKDAKEKTVAAKPTVAVKIIKNIEEMRINNKKIQNKFDNFKNDNKQTITGNSGHKKLQNYKSSLISIKSEEQLGLGEQKQTKIEQSMIMVDYFHPNKQQFYQIQKYLDRSKKIN